MIRSPSDGPDAVSSLYNEGLALAEDGRHEAAIEVLSRLVEIAPTDGGAHLLLAKVYAGTHAWRRALASLDTAQKHGTKVHADLRAAVVRKIEGDGAAPGGAKPSGSRDAQVDVDALRDELDRLRTENGHQLDTIRRLQAEAARWAWIAVATSGMAGVLLLTKMVVGEPAVVDASMASPPVVATRSPAPTAPVRDAEAASAAQAVLDHAEGLHRAHLEVVARGAHAELSGTVDTHAQVREAVRLVGGLDGLEVVGFSSVTVLARTKGARHVVVSGDTLSKIAWDHYGDETRHDVLLAANEVLEGKISRLTIGMDLVIPPLPVE